MARLMSAKETAEFMGISKDRVLTLARENVLPPGVVVRLGRQVRFNADKLAEWIDTGGQALPGGWKKVAD